MTEGISELGLLLRDTSRLPRAQLGSNEDEPDDLAEHNNCHAVDVEPQVTDADAKNDEWGNDAAVDGDSAAESSVPQRGDAPKNDCDRGGHGINARESLIDLKDAVDRSEEHTSELQSPMY